MGHDAMCSGICLVKGGSGGVFVSHVTTNLHIPYPQNPYRVCPCNLYRQAGIAPAMHTG